MKTSIFLALLLALCLLHAQAQSTILTYIVQREIDQDDHYVELTLKVQADGISLKNNIQRASDVIQAIKKIAIDDCQKATNDKKEAKKCQDIVEDSKFQVEPKYHTVRKVPTFTLFILTHEVTIKVKNIKGLGKLIDQIVDEGQDLVTLQEFVWKAENEVDPEVQTLKDGLQEGKQLCKKIGKELEEVVSVQQLQPKEEEEEQEDNKDEDLAEPEVETVVLKFKVKCGSSKSKDKTGKKK